MRRFSTLVTATAFALSLTLGLTAGRAQAAAGYDSSYQFESAFLNLAPGDSGTFAVFFANTGSTAWVKGTASQVNLAICDATKVFCNVTGPNQAFASGWLSAIAYATHTKDVVTPGDFSPFSYTVKVPTGQATGTYRFNGDLVVATTAERIHPEGYYQDATVTAPTITLGFTPDYSKDEDNEVSATVPGIGQHTYNVQTTLSGTLSFVTLPSSNIQKNADGSFSFCDANQDKKADGVGGGSVVFTAVNGTSIPPSTQLVNQTIPASGQMTVTIDSSTRNQRVRVVAWQDKNQNSQLDLTASGPDNTCNTLEPYDVTNDGQIAVSGRKFYFGPKGQFGSQFPDASGNAQCVPVYRHDATNMVFSAGTTSDTSLRFIYDSNDIFQLNSTQISLSVFQASLNAQPDGTGSTIKINYDPNSAGISTFNICNSSGAAAPSNVSAATGNFDNGSSAEDVRITFTAPSSNQVTSYNIQRAPVTGTSDNVKCNLNATAPGQSDSQGAPAGNTFTTVGSVNVVAGQTGTFTNFDLANGGYCFRVTVQNPTVGLTSFSNYVPVNIPGTADLTQPRSTNAALTSNGGFANTFDDADKIVFDFDKQMSLASNAVVRFTDSDCGTATNAGPAMCNGNMSNSVGDVICGTNASCVLQTGPNGANTELVIQLTSNPTVVSAGSVTGLQFTIVVTDVSGITDLSGNTWNLSGSPKRIIP